MSERMLPLIPMWTGCAASTLLVLAHQGAIVFLTIGQCAVWGQNFRCGWVGGGGGGLAAAVQAQRGSTGSSVQNLSPIEVLHVLRTVMFESNQIMCLRDHCSLRVNSVQKHGREMVTYQGPPVRDESMKCKGPVKNVTRVQNYRKKLKN